MDLFTSVLCYDASGNIWISEIHSLATDMNATGHGALRKGGVLLLSTNMDDLMLLFTVKQ